MNLDELTAVFDQQAASYDARWARLAPIRDAMFLLLDPVLTSLPTDARILSVGVGTGLELGDLARRFPRWRFTAVDPSGAMLAVCRRRAREEGFHGRCEFHEGFLDTLPHAAPYDGATCLLVSQFLLDPSARMALFRAIADRLHPGALLVSSDLAAPADAAVYEQLLRSWLGAMTAADVTPDAVERARAAYDRDVAILAPARVAEVMERAGFAPPVPFFQAGLLHAWHARRTAPETVVMREDHHVATA